MNKHLFLSGPIQTGKSTILQKAIAPYRQYIGGFVSQRIKDNTGKTVGFRLADYEEYPELNIQYSSELEDIFMIHEEFPVIDLSVFEKKGIDILRRTISEKKILLLDEIGGIELKSEAFRNVLFSAFNSIPCIGILKAPASAHNMQTNSEKDNAELLDFMSKNGTIILSDKNWMHVDNLACIQNHIEEILE